MIIEFEINGARVIVSGENLSVNITQDCEPVAAAGLSETSRVDFAPKAEDIRALRKAMGLRQHQFCKLLGVTQATISRWETGEERPRGSAAVLLHKMLGEAA